MERYFVMDSMERTFTYGVKVYQVWSRSASVIAEDSYADPVNALEYETSSKAKAEAVCEYLTLKAEQAYIDTWRSPDIRGTVVPNSIKV